MASLSMNQMTTYRWSFEEDLQHYAAAGFGAIGVWRHKLSDFGEEKGAELIREHGLQVSSLAWAGGFTGGDGRTLQESLEDALDAVRVAAELQATALLIHTGSRAGHTHNHARRLVKSALAEVANFAGERGVLLAVEPMHPGCAADWTFVTTLAEALDLVADVDSPALKIALDTYHLCHEGVPAIDHPEVLEQIAIVQLGDAKLPPAGDEQNRCRLGEGCIPLSDIVSRLVRSGYRGFWEIELLGEDVESSDYCELLAESHRVALQYFGADRKIA
jgi:sugar phosphate isomerase/epimerase